MAPSRSATSITWSVGTNRNTASLSTNFLISQGQATRSTLTCPRVIHFIEMFSFSLIWASSFLVRFTGELGIQGIVDESSPLQGNLVVGTSEADPPTDKIQARC